MILRKLFDFISRLFDNLNKQIRNIYLNSSIYEKKISKIYNKEITYKPSPHLLTSLIKYQSKKVNIQNISAENLWDNENINTDNFKRLNNFYWFFSLDLKSSKKIHKKLYPIGLIEITNIILKVGKLV